MLVLKNLAKPKHSPAVLLVPCIRTQKLAPLIWMMPPPPHTPISKLGGLGIMTEGKQVVLQELD